MARVFRFRLEGWLTLLKSREAAQQQVTAACGREVQRRRQAVEVARKSEWEAIEAMRRVREEGRVEAARQLQFLEWRSHLADRVMREAEALKVAEASSDAARAVLVSRARDVKVLENLRERRRAAHRVEVERQEQAAMDEAGVQRHASRRGECIAGGGVVAC